MGLRRAVGVYGATLALAFAALGGGGCGGSTSDGSGARGGTAQGGGSGSGGQTSSGGHSGSGGSTSPTECSVAADCTWGEIDREITRPEDCPCLLGCPSIPQNKTTAARRAAQYAALCDPFTDGQGNQCPVDDCIPPPPVACVLNQCDVPEG